MPAFWTETSLYCGIRIRPTTVIWWRRGSNGDDETTLKFLYREGRNVRLQPANPNPQFKPIIRPAEKVRINGKVVSVIRLLH